MSADAPASEPATLLPPELDFDYSQFVTEDDTPLDSFYQEKQQRLLADTLLASWAGPGDGRPWVVGANVGIFYARKKPAIVPDNFVSIDVTCDDDYSKKENRSYFIWDHDGKPPYIVVEFVSNAEGGEDTGKLKTYATVGVAYYAIFDPLRILSDEPLRVYSRQAGRLVPTAERFFPEIGLGLAVWHGTYEGSTNEWLRWTDEGGTPLPTGVEARDVEKERATIAEGRFAKERQRAEAERQRAEAERQRAEAESARAENERLRAERLAERLRQAGLDDMGD